MRAEVPEHQMPVSSITRKLVALLLECLRNCLGIGNDSLGVLDESGGAHLEELSSQAPDLVIVRAALQRREDCIVDAILEDLAQDLADAASLRLDRF